ncbi:MAG TPA: ECF-type sigma factor [Verrucomicrobiae bacterium]|nr:ECF-type sigma factor [Verrucomicrobiae bacterium]
MGDIANILDAVHQGDLKAAEQLLPLVYEELRRLAASKLSAEKAPQTLQPTALVHEAWLRLAREEKQAWNGRTHFMSAAAEAMRRILIDNARRKRAIRHGGGQERVDMDDLGLEICAPDTDDEELLAIHEALDALAAHDARKAEVVKLHFFVGLTLGETAEALAVSEPTAKRDWTYARTWLFRELERRRSAGE